MNHDKKNIRPGWFFPVLLFLITIAVGSAAWGQTPQWCTFWGQATFRGAAVGSSDKVEAYNASGNLCGEIFGNSGWYSVVVYGVYEDSPYYPNGATEGGVITFKINGQTANIISGSNTWAANESKQVDIQVPYEINVIANPGGPYTGQEGSAIQFNGSGSQDAVTYEWNFGDSGTGSGVSPTHTYVNNGTYTVTLTCRNGTKSDTKTTTATVSNVAPQNVNAGGNKSGNEGASISFSGSATDPGAQDVLTYSWNFGDSQTGTGQNVTHAYADNGPYTVTLTVRDNNGGEGSAQATATISNVAPTAEAGGPYTGLIGVNVQFNGSATDPGSADRATLAYAWDLDNDGQYDDAAVAAPQKIFYSEGTFSVSLRVTDKDGGSSTDGSTVQVSNAVQITINTNPTGRQIKADNQTYTAPKTFLWAPGSQHTLEAPTQYPAADFRYVWTSWSQGGNVQQTYTTPAGNTTLTANFKSQYYLKVESPYGNPQGANWYDPGSQVTFSVTSPASGTSGVRYVFTGWTGTGNGSYTGTEPSRTIQINNGVIETAAWRTEYFLSTSVDPEGSGQVTPAPPGAWYASGAQAEVSATPLGDNVWSGWSGDLTGNASPTTLTMSGPKSVVANFIKQIQIATNTNPTGLGFQADGISYSQSQTFQWAQGSTHTLSAPQTQSGGTGIQYVFTDWTDGGAREHAYTVPATNATITANYKTQYFLTIVSERGNPLGQGWYDAGALASFGVDSTSAGAAGERYKFTAWTGSGTGGYSGANRSFSLIMNGPVTETASWKRQCYVTLGVEPAGSGAVHPIHAPGGWADAGVTLKLTAVGNAAGGYGFFRWTGAVTNSENPLSILIESPISLAAHFEKGLIQITSDPPGLLLVVDGVEIVSPKVYNWATGTTHSLGVVSPQGDSSAALYVFQSWSDGGAAGHDVTLSQSTATYTARFDAAYRVSIDSDYGTPRINEVPAFYGFFPKGSPISITIDSLAPLTPTIRKRFNGWSGKGSGSLTTADRAIQLVVNGPITQTAAWQSQFTVVTHKEPSYAPGAAITLDPAGPWFDQGGGVTLSAVISDTSYTFLGWSGSATGASAVIQVVVAAPMDITGTFETPNKPPVIAQIPMFDLLEGDTLIRSLNWFLGFIHDANDPLETLTYGLTPPQHVRVSLDTINRELTLAPDSDWNGLESIVFWVTDPFGESDYDTVDVRVRSVSDPPKPFKLLSPASEIQLYSWDDPMTFRWQQSRNVDEGDSIQYSFYLSPNINLIGLGTFRIPNLQDTVITIFPQVAGAYFWGVRAEDTQGNQVWCDEIFSMNILSAVEGETRIPETYSLKQNYPNPFNPATVVPYELPRTSEVRIEVFDSYGRHVRTLIDQRQEAGFHQAVWNGANDRGIPVASGVYIILMRTPEYRSQHKMILMR